jgi:hypothetical protein
MNRLRRTLAPAVLTVLSSCISSDGTGHVSVSVIGAVQDYFSGGGVSDVSAAANASGPSGTTSGDGSYVIQGVPESEALVLVASKTGYRPTRKLRGICHDRDRSTQPSTPTWPVTADLSVVGVPDVQRQYTAVSLVV